MIVAVTGADGFIGTHLCLALEDRGFSVRRLSRKPGSQDRPWIWRYRKPIGSRRLMARTWSSTSPGWRMTFEVRRGSRRTRTWPSTRLGLLGWRLPPHQLEPSGSSRSARSRYLGTRHVTGFGSARVTRSHRWVCMRSRRPRGRNSPARRSLHRNRVCGGAAATCVRHSLQREPGRVGEGDSQGRIPLPVGHPTIGARTYVQMGDLVGPMLLIVGHGTVDAHHARTVRP